MNFRYFRYKNSVFTLPAFVASVIACCMIFASCSNENVYFKKGEQRYATGEYYQAAAYYKRSYQRISTKDRLKRADRSMRMGICYAQINNTQKAMQAFQNAVRYGLPDSTSLLRLGQQQLKLANYKGARESFEKYLALDPGNELARAGLLSCELAPQWKAEPNLYIVKKEAMFSSNRSDFSPLLVGDDAQLPPVGQVRSPALDVNQLRGYGLDVVAMQLTEVARQQLDSGILANATVLRQQLNDGLVEALPRVRYKCFNDVRRIDGYEFLECLETSYSRQGLDDTIIITRSNKRANHFNQGVRNQILGREEELSAGDRLLVVRNNYFWGKEFDQLPFIANGDVVDVKRVRNVREMYGFRFADAEILLPDYDIETEVTLMLDTLAVEGPNLPQSRQQELFAAIAQDYPEIRNQRDLYKMMKANPYFNALQVKYGYCVTCHKSQGGQWSDVYLDVGYINPEHLGVDFYRWIYTAFTRATQTLYLVNPSEDMLASD